MTSESGYKIEIIVQDFLKGGQFSSSIHGHIVVHKKLRVVIMHFFFFFVRPR